MTNYLMLQELHKSSVLASAQSWGVKILFVDVILYCNENSVCVNKHRVTCSELLSTADGTVLMPKFCIVILQLTKKQSPDQYRNKREKSLGEKLVLLLNLVSDVLLYLKRLSREIFSVTHKKSEVRLIFAVLNCKTVSNCSV